MKIVLFSLAPMEKKEETYIPLKNTFVYRSSSPYNIYLLGAIIEQGGYEITIKDWLSETYELEEMPGELLNFDIIMISSNSLNWHPSRLLIEKLRSLRDDQIIIVGGLQATLFGRKIIEEFPVDYVIRGEGEKSVIPLMKLLEKKGKEDEVPGLIYKKNGDIIINPVSPLLTPEEIARLPVPLYDRLPAGTCNWLSIESSRGCVNHCIYCSVPYQKSWRAVKAEDFVKRIETFMPYLSRVISGKFLIIDDSFIIDIKRAREIAKILKEKRIEIQAIWNSHVIELFEKEMLIDLAPFTDSILIGAESFDEDTLKRIGKKFAPDDIVKGAHSAVNIGLGKKLIFSFIVGFPWQNKESILREIDKIYDLVITTGACAIINWLILNPGSRLWNEFYAKKKVALRDYGKLYDDWKKEVFPISREELQEMNFYISYLQSTIRDGVYRFQQHSGIYDKIS